MQRRTVALVGNPNVGKSTVFNGLTGLSQHTGNWPGKTVEIAKGVVNARDIACTLVDLPGSYSLLAHSAEEEIARDFICFENPDAVVVVCDASCLERNINLVLQVLEVHPRTLVCVNLMDEAQKKKIHIDIDRLSALLGVPVCGCAARSRQGMDALLEKLAAVLRDDAPAAAAMRVPYQNIIEEAIALVQSQVADCARQERLPARWVALRLLERDPSILASLLHYTGVDFEALAGDVLLAARALLAAQAITEEALRDLIVKDIYMAAEKICGEAVAFGDINYNRRQLRVDRFLTDPRTGKLCMLALLAVVFWITIAGANAPSVWLHALFKRGEEWLAKCGEAVGCPWWLYGPLVPGAYRVMAWVVSVMLPPMAIFFPLFTLLEDVGYLPRIAFNLDRHLKGCGACGKQALTMCLGFGCNACGVTGCRIIDSPRERLIAIITNSLVPCNGRFPLLIAIPSMFFIGAGVSAAAGAIVPAVCLTGLVLLSVGVTLLSSRMLSRTLLRGKASSFTLELPPYRRPQIVPVVVRSLFDRTFFVLRRAVAVALPAGMILWLLANITPGGISLLLRMTTFLEPAGRLMGMDGVILGAFILGFPANEIVLPIALMAYLCQGTIDEMPDLIALKAILVRNGWTAVTAICTILFSMMHWPCSTTCITIYKETGSVKWTAVSFLLPTLMGAAVCVVIAFVGRML